MRQFQIILRIATPIPLYKGLDYVLPDNWLDNNIDGFSSDRCNVLKTVKQKLKPGIRIKVPLGNKVVIGILLEITTETDTPHKKLKSIIEIVDLEPCFTEELLNLCCWGADYYHYPIGEVLNNALPKLLREGSKMIYKSARYWCVNNNGKIYDINSLKRAHKQKALLELLRENVSGLTQSEIIASKIPKSSIESLQKKGLITIKKREISCKQLEKKFKLNAAQQEAADQIIKKKNFQCFLLNGVTGSGKTEVYLHVVENILEKKQQALVLVPEIALTPQILNRFQRRFGCLILCLHSALNDHERLNAWAAAKQGDASIIIGTRSAIFTPCINLGVIIIDEEHDLSFKQKNGFRYSAKDLAIVRARKLNIPIVLGSATPSLESLYNVECKRYQPLYLPERAGGALHPKYRIIDIRNKPSHHGISETLLKNMQAHLATKKSQVLLFLNRRGFSPTMMCYTCGWIIPCRNCDAYMTLHQNPPHLRCHHCNYVQKIPEFCQNCKNPKLQPIGFGTERIESALQKYFPDTEIIRIDRDTTRRKNAFCNIFRRIEEGSNQILIGTQMLAKGHHFPNVTLVGVINNDAGFFSSDFRSIEHTGQLLLQVAGRSGRAKKEGEVLIQTHKPNHPLLLTLLKKGYIDFAKKLLQEREIVELPPYSYFTLLRAEALESSLPEIFLNEVKNYIYNLNIKEVASLGPIPSLMFKRKRYFRAQLLLQSKHRKYLQQLLNSLVPKINQFKSSRKVRWAIDVDPVDIY